MFTLATSQSSLPELFRKAQSDSRKGAEIGKKMLASRLGT
jgi:hypothetical protein